MKFVASWAPIPEELILCKAGLAGRPSNKSKEFSNFHGIYFFADRELKGTVDLKTDPIIYVGQTGLQGFWRRWTNTHHGLDRMGKKRAEDSEIRFSLAIIPIEFESRNVEINGISICESEANGIRYGIAIRDLEKTLKKFLSENNKVYSDPLRTVSEEKSSYRQVKRSQAQSKK